MFWRAVCSASSIFAFSSAFGLVSVVVVVSAGVMSVRNCEDVRVTRRARTISARRETENLASVSKTRAAEGL